MPRTLRTTRRPCYPSLMTEREFATEVVVKLQHAGFRALWAGGCVRDELLGLTPADHDVATDALPDQVKGLFKRCFSFGASFGVVEVLGPRGPDGEWLKVQVATFRSDGTYSDGRRPDSVTYTSPEEDASRRDFTINGLFFDPVRKVVFDYVGGQEDLKARRLRAIGNAEERFREDKLRILRAVRMAARFDLTIDPETFAAARRMADQIRVVSAERIAEELRKVLAHPSRGRGVRLLKEFDLVSPILPELATAETGWDALAKVVDALPTNASFPLAFAALLHGLPEKQIVEVCRRLKLSNDESEAVTWLATHYRALTSASTMRPSQLHPMLVHPGIADLLRLHEAIATANGESADHVRFCEEKLRSTPAEVLNPPPLLTGDDLRSLGWKPGPLFKRVLDAVRVAQLDGEVRSREDAIQLARAVAVQ